MLKVFKKIWSFAPREKGNLTLAIVCEFLSAILQAFQMFALFIAVDSIIKGNISSKIVLIVASIMVLSIVFKFIVSYFAQLDSTHAGFFMVADKRINIGNKLKSVSMGYFNKKNLGDITGVTTTILSDLEQMASRILVMVLSGFINTIIFTILVFLFDWRIGIWCCMGIIIYLIAINFGQNYAKKNLKARQEAQKNLVLATLENIQGMLVIKAFQLDGKSNEKMNKAIEESKTKNLANEKSLLPVMCLQDLIIHIFTVGIVAISLLLYLSGKMELVYMLLMLVVSFSFFSQLETSGSIASIIRLVENSIDRAEELDNMPQMEDNNDFKELKNHDVVFNNVSFSYENKKILDGVSFSIQDSKMTAIVGPSGSGKTTICNLISRLWDIDEGTIKLGNVDIRELPLKQLMSNISTVFQNVYLFKDTIENNIRFGKEDATFEEIVEAAKKAQAYDFIMHLPNGFNTVIGEGGTSLSGGEKQRISIARAIIKDAPIIILDEATSNIDPENENKLQKAFQGLTKDKTVIMIAHRLKTIQNADKIIVLDKGKIVEEGTHLELQKNNGLYCRLIRAREKAHGWKILI